MTSFNWFGGYGRYSAARHWDPRGVPGQGDTAVIAKGEAVARWQDIQATVSIGGIDAGSQPALDLRSSSLGVLTMPDSLQQPVNNTVPVIPNYATVNIWGQSSIGAINVGDFANTNRAPDPFGHGPIGAPETLTINLNGRATLDAGFDIKYGTVLTVNGGHRSSLNAADSTIEGGRVVVNAPLAGAGTIYMTNGPLDYTGSAFTGSLELGGSVGSADTIDIRMGTLLVDKPLEFEGKIDLRPNEFVVGQPYAIGEQDLMLKGIVATSYSFDDSNHTMTLFDGGAALDQVRFTPDVVAAFFGHHIAQTADGVFVGGAVSHFPNGATEIPLHI